MTRRPLGTMIAYGFSGLGLSGELDLALRIGASVLEILPDWKVLPDPDELGREVSDRGLKIHSAHGCWGGQAIAADRVDLGSADETTRRESVDDLRRCIDWVASAGGTHLVVHPGGLSDPADRSERARALADGLVALADHASNTPVIVCVENMPPGVYPGSRMEELHAIVAEIARPNLALALDTGHAHISADLHAETAATRDLLATTHVHDNDGRRDIHEVPGRGTIDWEAWAKALDRIDYRGPILLECVRRLREAPDLFRAAVIAPLLEIDGG